MKYASACQFEGLTDIIRAKTVEGHNLESFDKLVAIIDRLRGPNGCPWDREQTHSSLKGNLTEETYEVLEAIDEGDMGKLCEELGDLLMQIVLHAQIASEGDDFNIDDVTLGISTKLIRRHPHVFADAEAKDAQQVIANWEVLKREEGKGSLLSGLPKEMPALAYSQAMGRRVARVGFDWEDLTGIVEKLAEEVAEFSEAIEHQERVREFGDLLFTLANIARHIDIDLEAALRGANERFYRRFSHMEEACQKRGISLSSLSPEEQNALWEQAKRVESEREDI
jgi:tetrapyrrole methylase family protein/MazG family protein